MSEIKIEKRKIGTFDSIIMTDEDGSTTVCFNGEGGAIISHMNKEEAIKRYYEGMKLAESIRKLQYFKHTNEFPSA